MAMAPHVTIPELVRQLELPRGGVLWVASDLFRLGYAAWENGERFQPGDLIDQLLDALGPDGTLLFPAFTWGPLRGEAFDLRRSAPDTGTLSRVAWKRRDFGRTRHPVHSFCVTGPMRDELCALENRSSFGGDSPFAALHRVGARMLMIDIDYQGSFTFVHYVEESEGVWYRRLRDYPVRYTDASGETRSERYTVSTRLPGVYTYVVDLGTELERRGDAVRREINGIPFRLIDLVRAHDTIRAEIREHGGRRLYCLLPRRLVIGARRVLAARRAKRRAR